MQAILTDIEHRIQKLKSRIDTVSASTDPRFFQNMESELAGMKQQLDAFLNKLEQNRNTEKSALNGNTTSFYELRQLISLNDSFRFSRELFSGNVDKMNQVFSNINKIPIFNEALSYLSSEIAPDDENDSLNDFKVILENFYSQKKAHL